MSVLTAFNSVVLDKSEPTLNLSAIDIGAQSFSCGLIMLRYSRASNSLHLRSIPRLVIQRRSFHATSPRPLVDECLFQTHALLSGFHDISGLPWAATIPLTALIVKATLFPVEFYAQSVQRRFLSLQPHVEAMRVVIQRDIARRHIGKSALEEDKILRRSMKNLKGFRRHRGQIKNWKMLVEFIKIPIWLAIMSTLHKMSGVHEEISALIGKSLTGGRSTATAIDDISVVPVESSLSAEGMLWFPNLALPDPALILPFLLAGAVFVGSRWLPTFVNLAHTRKEGQRRFQFKTLVVKIIKVSSLAVAPATMQFPSAMLLYSLSSTVFGIGSHIFLERFFGRPPPPPKPKPIPQNKKQRFRGPTMQDLRSQQKKK